MNKPVPSKAKGPVPSNAEGTITGTPDPRWSPGYLAAHRHLAERGYTIRYQENAALISPPPTEPTTPPAHRYTGRPMVKAAWAPPGMTIWVPDMETNP